MDPKANQRTLRIFNIEGQYNSCFFEEYQILSIFMIKLFDNAKCKDQFNSPRKVISVAFFLKTV